MKGLLKNIISKTLICSLLTVSAACSEEADCSMNARAMMQCNLYQINEETEVEEGIELERLTVTAWGTDSVIVNNMSNVSNVALPLRYAADSTVLVFHYQMEPKDTLIVRHANTPYFLSMDCGYQMKQTITDISYTRHQLDSISITHKEAGIYGQENVKLFY
ncbi:MAG: calcium-binding protein P [Mediterranea massiliensis]|nr:calcium-binding protein P [Mediterranea massiliensis]